MTPDRRPILLWFRRDLRLADHPALVHACESGRPVLPVFLCDEGVEALGAAPKMRLGMSVAALARGLEGQGSRLILRRGPALVALRSLIAETGAAAIAWTRLHDPLSQARDQQVAVALRADGIEVRVCPGHLLHEPEKVRTGAGGAFKVYTPFFNAVRSRDPGAPLPVPARIPVPDRWPASDTLEAWRLDAAMNRGGPIVAQWQRPGEAGARERLDRFLAERVGPYAQARQMMAVDGSSRLSENLTYGEISARTCWHEGRAALDRGEAGAEQFLKEIAWRDFAHHLLFDSPRIASDHWKPGWEGFPWAREADSPRVLAWQQGRTGIRVVDAAMREMYVTGRMHNRARMVVASFLTKHLLTDWRVGLKWFEDCLTDWDPASNAVNWQWVAGSGPDAQPFFRIFSPASQSKSYDPEQAYERTWIAEGQPRPPATALAFFEAAPRSWRLSPRDPYPRPIIDLAEGREAALAAFRARRQGTGAEEGA